MEHTEYIEEEGTISLQDIFETIKKHFWFLVVTTLLGGLILGSYAFFIATPKYKSTGAIMVQVSAGENGAVSTVESQRLVQSTMDLLTEIDLIPSEAAKELQARGYNLTLNEVRDNMSVSNNSGSLLIQISFISTDEELAEEAVEVIINSLISISSLEVYNMDKTLKDNLSYLYVSEAKFHSPNKILITFVGLFFVVVIGLVLVCIIYNMYFIHVIYI